jgi:hypothetical protein
MQKRSRKPRQPKDVNQAAFAMVTRSETVDKPKMSRAEVLQFMRTMGSKGGKKGGKNHWNEERLRSLWLKAVAPSDPAEIETFLWEFRDALHEYIDQLRAGAKPPQWTRLG